MKRTRPIRGKYWIESPRIAYKGDVISIRMKVSQVQVKYHGGAKYDKSEGEIERGSIDAEEERKKRVKKNVKEYLDEYKDVIGKLAD